MIAEAILYLLFLILVTLMITLQFDVERVRFL